MTDGTVIEKRMDHMGSKRKRRDEIFHEKGSRKFITLPHSSSMSSKGE